MEAKETVKTSKSSGKLSTQRFLKISEIRDDTLVLKNGGLRAILKVSSINFNLKSEAEQNSIVYSYQQFLNSLEFDIQIVVRSKKLDVDEYVADVRTRADSQTNPLLKRQTLEYAEYIQKLIEYADIMEKEFYVVVPFNPPRAEKKGMFKQFWEHLHPADSIVEIKRRHSEFEELRKGLSQRLNVVKTGLAQMGLMVEDLTTKDLIELFYKIYNPGVSRNQKVAGDALDDLEKDIV